MARKIRSAHICIFRKRCTPLRRAWRRFLQFRGYRLRNRSPRFRVIPLLSEQSDTKRLPWQERASRPQKISRRTERTPAGKGDGMLLLFRISGEYETHSIATWKIGSAHFYTFRKKSPAVVASGGRKVLGPISRLSSAKLRQTIARIE